MFTFSRKQVTLAALGRDSQFAFYSADTAAECALYWDQQKNAFDYTTPLGAGSLLCNTLGATSYVTNQLTTPNRRVTTFVIPCNPNTGGTTQLGKITVNKWSTGSTTVFATGYNICDPTDKRRIERGLKVVY